MTAIETKRPGGTGVWAPVVPEPRDPQEWVGHKADEDEGFAPLIVRSVD